MSDNERPRDRYRERVSHREPREARGGDRDREGTPGDRRNRSRSRSPRRERGGRRGGNNRYRSRSPPRKDGRDRDNAQESRGRGRNDYDKDDRSRRDPPRGPRGGASAPSGPRRSDFQPRGGAVKPPSGPRAAADSDKKEVTPDVEMKDDPQKPEDMDDDTWAMMRTMGFKGFKSTKNTKVPGNDKNFGIRKDKQMEARQYMNRQGGFNRPLSPGRS